MDRTAGKRFLGSIFLTLSLTLIFQALRSFGVVSVAVGELCLIGAWFVGITGIVFSEWIWDRPIRDKIFIALMGAIVYGALLSGLNNWAMAHRPEAPKTAQVSENVTPGPQAQRANPKPSMAKPRQPKQFSPPASPALLPAPQLSPNAVPAPSMSRPQTPIYAPVPTPSTSPYQELKNEIAEVERIAQQWTSDLSSAISTRNLLERKLDSKARKEAMATAEPMYRDSVVRADDRCIEHWHTIAGAVEKAHSDAIARMSQPGPMQWPPNQISRDKAEFDSLIAPLGRQIEDPGSPDRQKFAPLLGYLKDLQGKLGDYPESVTPPH